MSEPVAGLDPARLIEVVRRRIIPILACTAAGAIVALGLSLSSTKAYRSTARLYVSIPDAGGVDEALKGVQLTSQLLESYAQIATSRSAAGAVSVRLGGRVSPQAVRSSLRATALEGTLLIDVSATGEDPARMKEIADAGAAELIAAIENLETTTRGPVKAKVIDAATLPSKPLSPTTRTDAVIGLLVGLGAGVGLALILEAAGRRPASDGSGASDPALATTTGIATLEPLLETMADRLTALEHRLVGIEGKIDAVQPAVVTPRAIRPARSRISSAPDELSEPAAPIQRRRRVAGTA